jgi:membrane protein implicated in regulation of membrane protease activity
MLEFVRVTLAGKDIPADAITAGWLGGVFFVSLAVASVLLWRNMDKRIKRLELRRREAERQDD